MFVDVHAVHSVPVANLNSDMSRMPKTVVYGGVTRARVSSQAWNFAIRRHVGGVEQLGVRTRDVLAFVSAGVSDGLRDMLSDKRNKVLPFNAKTGLLKSAFFFSHQQLTGLERLVEMGFEDVNSGLVSVLSDRGDMNVDVGLFGSTLTSLPEANVFAAVSSAHSFSTHEVRLEFDEFVGTDDVSLVNGGSHVGVRDFVSATFYRYSTVNVGELSRNVGSGRVGGALSAFLEGFASAVPVGSRNTMSAVTRPSLLSVVVRDGRPESYAGAFESPIISGSSGGFVEPSIDRLNVFHRHHVGSWGEPLKTLVVCPDVPGMVFGGVNSVSFPELVQEVVGFVSEHVG